MFRAQKGLCDKIGAARVIICAVQAPHFIHPLASTITVATPTCVPIRRPAPPTGVDGELIKDRIGKPVTQNLCEDASENKRPRHHRFVCCTVLQRLPLHSSTLFTGKAITSVDSRIADLFQCHYYYPALVMSAIQRGAAEL